jgi:hypothetical protein
MKGKVGENEGFLFNRYRVWVLQDEKCSRDWLAWMHIIPLKLKNGLRW